MEAGGWAGPIVVHDVSECFERETLALYCSLPRNLRDRAGATSAALVAAAHLDLGNAFATDDTDRAMAMWQEWKTVREKVDNIICEHAVASSDNLLWASRAGCHVRVGLASAAEVEALAECSGEEPREGLTAWSLVAVRDPTAPTTVHALGRLGGGEPWLTFPLVAADPTSGFVKTRWGDTYKLSGADDGGVGPEMREHLRHAMEEAGYENVRG